ncbi:hypothetical protein [uncultured Rhodospira sp.]|uniref:hypothetical protein n=1 Tax=uncultured Rhodospira sp. TaxID=1936189 RepID=UPI00260E2928|nr:hypothetical protein [uncultured Rhodospira sp.]
MKVSYRILAGFVAVLSLTAFVSVVGWQSLEQSSGGFETERTGLRALVRLGQTVKTELHGRLVGDLDAADDVQAGLAEIEATLAVLAQRPGLRQPVAAAQEAIATYRADYEAFLANARAVRTAEAQVVTLDAELGGIIAGVVEERVGQLQAARDSAHAAMEKRDHADALAQALTAVNQGLSKSSKALEDVERENTEARSLRAGAEIKALGAMVQRLIDADQGSGLVDAAVLTGRWTACSRRSKPSKTARLSSAPYRPNRPPPRPRWTRQRQSWRIKSPPTVRRRRMTLQPGARPGRHRRPC